MRIRPNMGFLRATTLSGTLHPEEPIRIHSIHPSSHCRSISFLSGRLPPNHSKEDDRFLFDQPLSSTVLKAFFSTEENTNIVGPTEVVQDVYLKMLKSVKARTMPPNVLLRTMFDKCVNIEDVKLLFQILQRLRTFRLSNLRIHDNFNSQYCMKVAEACAHAGAIDFGLKTLWKHNVYGLTPSVGSAHYLLRYAKEHNDVKAMAEILEVMRKNSLKLQPTTADIVFSICYDSGNWDLMCKYAKKFIKSGVKLHQAAYDNWMTFAAKMGKVDSIWEIEQRRSDDGKQHTISSAFACAKGYLLQQQPENSALVIHLLSQNLPETKKPLIQEELQKLVSEWISEVEKWKSKEESKDFSVQLKSDATAMVEHLRSMGLALKVHFHDKPLAS